MLTLFITACNNTDKTLRDRVINADSVAINYFKGDGKMDSVTAVKIIRDKQRIEQLANYISEKSTEKNAVCGFDGSIHFFQFNQVVQDIDFRMNDNSCMYFFYFLSGKHKASKLSAEAKAFIISLKNN